MGELVKISKISGTAVVVRGHDIDTDRIVPARYLKEATFARMGEYPFFDERFDASGGPKAHPFNDSRFRGASILLVNKNFGCGSSREHAPQALYRFGIHTIVGESFASIFAGNCVMMGLPAVTAAAEAIERLMTAVETSPAIVLTVDLERRTLICGEEEFPVELPETYRNALMSGCWDSTSLLRSRLDQVRKTAAGLPYMSGFAT